VGKADLEMLKTYRERTVIQLSQGNIVSYMIQSV
jgi:hypothetical protein